MIDAYTGENYDKISFYTEDHNHNTSGICTSVVCTISQESDFPWTLWNISLLSELQRVII